MKLLNERNLRAILIIGMGICLIVNHATRKTPESINDLTNYYGKISNYSFKDNVGYRKSGHQYYIYLNEYPTKFQIRANDFRFFNKLQFEQNFKKGDRVEVSIPDFQNHLVGTEEPVPIYSLYVNHTVYFTKEQTLELEKSSKGGYYLGIMFIGLGVLGFIFHEQLMKVLKIK